MCVHTHSHRARWEPGLGILPLSSPRALSRAGRGRPGPVRLSPSAPYHEATCSVLPCSCPSPKPFKKWPTPETSPYPIAAQKSLRTLLFWVVVAYFKNLEESLLRSIHCLLSFLYSWEQGKNRELGDLGCFYK